MPSGIAFKLNSSLRGQSAKIKSNLYNKLYKVAEEIAAIAQQLAPEDTGHLRDSISIKVTVTSGIIRIVCQTKDADHPEYSWFVEYGTSDSPAQPFLTPAAESVRARLDKMLSKLL